MHRGGLLQCASSLVYYEAETIVMEPLAHKCYTKSMSKNLLVVAALLLASSSMAAAADISTHLTQNADQIRTQKRAEKIVMALSAVGISDPALTELVQEVSTRTKDGYFLIHEEKIADGRLRINYQTKPGLNLKQLELHYTPEDSHMEYYARKDAVMATYSLKF